MNDNVIDQIFEFENNVMKKLSQRSIVSFNANQIEFDDNIYVGDALLSKKAMNKILNGLRVKQNFLNYNKMMDERDWDTIQNLLKNANANMHFYGKKENTNDGNIIDELYVNRDNPNLSTENYGVYFETLRNNLFASEKQFAIKQLSFDDDSEAINIKLLLENSSIDIFNNNIDIWKHGHDISWDHLKFSNAPFFERLICTNGMIAQNFGFKVTMQNKKFNVSQIEKEIQRLISNPDDRIRMELMEASNHLQRNNISLHEFYEFRKLFNTDTHAHLLSTVFNERDIFRFYGENPAEKSRKWLSTADSGRNAYDFINDMTYIGSHPNEVGISGDLSRVLHTKTGNLFFKKELDLEDIAPTINFRIQKTYED